VSANLKNARFGLVILVWFDLHWTGTIWPALSCLIGRILYWSYSL